MFKAKHGLPVLEDYDAPIFPADYWSKWEKKSFVDYDSVRSWVDLDLLLDLLRELATGTCPRLPRSAKP